MTISNEHSQDPSVPDQRFSQQPERSSQQEYAETLRFPPRRPVPRSQQPGMEMPPSQLTPYTAAPARREPVQHYYYQYPQQPQPSLRTSSRPLPLLPYPVVESAPPLASGPGWGRPGNGSSGPSFSPPPQPRRPRRGGRKVGVLMLLGLLLLVILVVLTAFLGHLIPDPTAFAGVATPTADPPLSNASGPFVRPPLSAAEINSLRHRFDHMNYRQLANLYVSHMTLDEELGQLIMVEYSDTYYSADLNTMITKLHAGGVIMYEFQMQSFAQTKHDIALMQQHAKIPLLISTDEEGGPYVHRLSHIYGPRPSAWDIYQSGKVSYATQEGHKMAHDLLALGINEDLAPDVDVMLVPGYDTVTRTFGTTPQSVITYAGAFMQAMQGDGLIACIKHYPGLGATVLDAHKTLPVINRTRDQIYSTELAPYKTFIQTQNKLQNPGMIMSTDLLMPKIDPVYPAELSHTFMTDILRKQFGYDGVVITDALYMQGIAEKWSMPEAAILALNAGNDMLLGPNGTDQTVAMLNGLKQALQDGRLSKARVDEAAARIIALKMQYHLLPATVPQG